MYSVVLHSSRHIREKVRDNVTIRKHRIKRVFKEFWTKIQKFTYTFSSSKGLREREFDSFAFLVEHRVLDQHVKWGPFVNFI